MVNIIYDLDLQLFAEEGAADVSGDMGQDAAGQTGEIGQDAAVQETQEQEEDLETAWQEARNGRFKQFFDRDMQGAIKERLKNSKQAEQVLEKLAPMLDNMQKKYGVQDGDIDGLMAKYQDDDALYEEEAMERGIDVGTMKQIKQLENRLAAEQRINEQSIQERQAQEHVMNLVRQGEQLKQLYPNFDLAAEMQNPEFRRLTGPGVNIDVKTAYQVIHANELQSQYVQAGAQQAAQKLAQSRSANRRRPSENASRSPAGQTLSQDYSKWGKDQFDEYKRRAERGEEIVFGS